MWTLWVLVKYEISRHFITIKKNPGHFSLKEKMRISLLELFFGSDVILDQKGLAI